MAGITKHYNLQSEEFIEKARFYKENLDIDLSGYFKADDKDNGENEGQLLDIKLLFKDTLTKVIDGYRSMGMELPDIDMEETAEKVFGDDYYKMPCFALPREKIYEVVNSHGDDLKTWINVYLTNCTNHILQWTETKNVEGIARAITIEGSLISFTSCCIGLVDYARLAWLSLKGYELLGGIGAYQGVLAALISSSSVVVAVLVGAVILSSILVSISSIDRELSCLVINDTDYDLTIEDIHMECGTLTAIPDDSQGYGKVVKRRSSNTVYCSFYTIEKKFGFYGAEATMRFLINGVPVYTLAANPLSQDTRVNLAIRENTCSKDMHEQLYDSGGIDVKLISDGLYLRTRVNSESGSKACAFMYLSEILCGTVDFTKQTPVYSTNIQNVGSGGWEYNGEKECISIMPGGWICFSLKKTWMYSTAILDLACKDNEGKNGVLSCYISSDNSFDINVYNSQEFSRYYVQLPVHDGRINELQDKGEYIGFQITNTGEQNIYLKKVEVRPCDISTGMSDWMMSVSDETVISEINIPGTHDSAAIHKGKCHTFYACHNQSITEQLKYGIRMFDVRIKVKKENSEIQLVTCHGSIGGATSVNEYQTLASLLDECKTFLEAHGTEMLIMSLKIDDDRAKDPVATVQALKELLGRYPIRQYKAEGIGTLGESRGKIILFNRMGGKGKEYLIDEFGYAVSWQDNTKGSYADTRGLKVYVQDYWNVSCGLNPDRDKADQVIAAMESKKENEIVWNYASGCKYFVIGVYCGEYLIHYFGSHRPAQFGWMMLDYENMVYDTDVYGAVNLVDIIVASNHGYVGVEKQFKIKSVEEGYPDTECL